MSDRLLSSAAVAVVLLLVVPGAHASAASCAGTLPLPPAPVGGTLGDDYAQTSTFGEASYENLNCAPGALSPGLQGVAAGVGGVTSVGAGSLMAYVAGIDTDPGTVVSRESQGVAYLELFAVLFVVVIPGSLTCYAATGDWSTCTRTLTPPGFTWEFACSNTTDPRQCADEIPGPDCPAYLPSPGGGIAGSTVDLANDAARQECKWSGLGAQWILPPAENDTTDYAVAGLNNMTGLTDSLGASVDSVVANGGQIPADILASPGPVGDIASTQEALTCEYALGAANCIP